MEKLFNYETAKQIVVLTAYWAILVFDIWWIGYMFVSIAQWIVKQVKKIYAKVRKLINRQ